MHRLLAGLLIVQGAFAALTPEEYEKRIAVLEQRVAALEKLVERIAPVSAAPPSTPVEAASRTEQSPLRPRDYTPPEPGRFETPPELVPDVGKVGLQVAILTSGATSPFKLNKGPFFAGLIDLPMFESRKLKGKLAYEILVGMSQSQTPMTITSNVAQVANLTVLNTLNPTGGLDNVVAAVTGTGPAPFHVKYDVETRLRLLQVVPFSFKYTSTAFDRFRFRPYGVVGFGTYVTIHNQNPARGASPTYGVRPDADIPAPVLAAVGGLFGGTSPFGAPLVAGQIANAPELIARGLPGGNGNIDFGLHSAAGFEYRLRGGFSIGFDARFNKVAGTNGWFRTYGSRFGFHF